jgi:uncharacterized protein
VSAAAVSPVTASCIYSGTIRHRRATPATDFTHRLSLAYVDLDELPRLLGGRLLRRGPGALRFRRSDYLGPRTTSLATAVRDRVAQLTGTRPDGPIRMLTQLRSFGICFNPVSFYYCMDGDSERMQAVLAEVTNTPWGERHAYALDDASPGSKLLTGTFDKRLHVSPFMSMDHVYRARATTPGQTLSVQIENHEQDVKVFEATLNLTRVPLTRRHVARMTAAHPAASARVLALIYARAAALKLSGARYHPHPAAAPAR